MDAQSPFVYYFRFIFAKLCLQINNRKFVNILQLFFENGEGPDQLC